MSSVLLRARRSGASASTTFLTPSSTESSDSSSQRYLRWMSAIWLALKRGGSDLGRLVGDVGLVEVRGPRQRLGVERVGVARRRVAAPGSPAAGSGSVGRRRVGAV